MEENIEDGEKGRNTGPRDLGKWRGFFISSLYYLLLPSIFLFHQALLDIGL